MPGSTLFLRYENYHIPLLVKKGTASYRSTSIPLCCLSAIPKHVKTGEVFCQTSPGDSQQTAHIASFLILVHKAAALVSQDQVSSC